MWNDEKRNSSSQNCVNGFAMYYSLMALLEFLNRSLHDNLQNCKCKIRQLGKILEDPTLLHQYSVSVLSLGLCLKEFVISKHSQLNGSMSSLQIHHKA